MRNKERKRSE